MLDQLPEHVWRDSKLTFLDPAMGGGQFLTEIVKRLRAQGHSDRNIRSRVFGVESNEGRINFFQLKGLPVQTAVGGVDFDCAKEFGLKKFDVGVGNPPYNIGNTDGAQTYTPFVKKLLEMSPKHLVLVLPSQIHRSYTNEIADTYNQLVENGLIKVKELGQVFTGANLNASYIVTDRSCLSPFPKKVLDIKGPYAFKGFKPVKKQVGKGRFFQGFKKGKPIFLDVDFIDINSKNAANNYRIVAPYILGGTYRWLERAVIIAPGDSCHGAWRFLPCKSKSHAKKLLAYLQSPSVQKIIDETAYSRTLDGTQTRFIPEMPE
jgi:hypothetical protein